MSATTAQSSSGRNRADELFQQHRQQIFRATDRLFARLMAVQWVAGIVLAFVLTPLTWAGQTSQIHLHVWAAIFLGGAITVFPIWLTYAWPGAAITRYVIAVAQTLMSALLISLTGGRIETHFHIFGSLVILSFYRDWRVLIPATLVVAVDHFVRGVFWPYSVYGVLTASPWRSLEHAGWVVFEDIFLVISCLRSITEMRSIAHRTAALEASEQKFRGVFEQAPIGIAVLGLDERLRNANATLCGMLGYTEQELHGRRPVDVTYADDIPLSANLADRMLQQDGEVQIEKRYVRKNGDLVWARRAGCVIRDESGAPREFLVMVEDISEQKRAELALKNAKEQAESANKAKSEFLSRMSHELRTPLNAILGFGQLLERKNPTDVQRTRINHILKAGRHLLDLINEVLDISRIEAGRIEMSVEPLPLDNLISETLDLIRPLAAERHIHISRLDAANSSSYVLADRQRLKQVLLNLLGNAVKYTREGGRVAISFSEIEDNQTRIVVTDNGPGIAPQNLSRVFTPFDRLGAECSSVPGTGLGLALSKRLVQAMGGTIGVQSDFGHGSTFWVHLPTAASPLTELAAVCNGSKREQVARPASTTRKRVLYVEDNLSNLTLIEQILAGDPSIELITAAQGGLALELARSHRPDVILLDLHLPDIPGWEVFAHLQASDATRGIPVVVISADATAGQIERLTNAGVHSYLTKPLDVDEFTSTLDEVTRNQTEPDAVGAAIA